MRIFRAVAALATAIALTACTSTLEELREESGETIAFHIVAPYATIYRNFSNTMKHCFGGGYGATYTVVQSSETVPGRVANITHWQKGIVERPLITVDLLQTQDGTDVIFHRRSGAGIFTDYPPLVRGWALGSGECPGITLMGTLEPPEVTRLPAETKITPLPVKSPAT
jgi:hypothetical protein